MEIAAMTEEEEIAAMTAEVVEISVAMTREFG